MRIVLINMPFGTPYMPSLALTQLEAVVRERFGDRVSVEVLYLNLDFHVWLSDTPIYAHALSDAGFMSGVGDWFFRQSAFPAAPDNRLEYFARFYFEDCAPGDELRRALTAKREALDAFLDERIASHALATADVVGFTAFFAQTVASLAMARRLKRIKPAVVTCLGGAACGGPAAAAVARCADAIDYVFAGPALVSFPAFIDRLLNGRDAGGATLSGIPRARGGAVGGVVAPGADRDIDRVVPLDYAGFLDAFEHAFPGRAVKPVLLFETSRGCYWADHGACSFCGLTGLCTQYRRMSPALAVEQFAALRRWLPRCRSFVAVDTIVPRDYPREVFPRLSASSGVRMLYEVRPDLEDEDIAAMCAAGVVAMQPGIEALSTPTLRLMRKGLTAFRNIRFLKACSRHAVSLDWNLLLFSPGESEATYKKYLRDLPLLAHLAPPTGAYPVNFVRHSRYHAEPGAYGLRLRPQDFYALTYPVEDGIIDDLANNFVDEAADVSRMDRWLSRINDCIDAWRCRWQGRDGRPQARLCFCGVGADEVVYDSRTGEEREYALGPVARRVLAELERPAAQADVAHRLNDVAPDDVHEAFDVLRAHGLLFEEDGRCLSLVAS